MAYKIVDAQFVLDNLGTLPIMDVRPPFMYEESRIPGAVSVSLLEAKEADGDTADLLAQWALEKGFAPEDEFIVYCYNGQLANEACTLLESKGYSGQVCYEGSWLDWISDPARPIEK